MRLDIFSLFPEAFDWFQGQRSVQNALGKGNELRLFNYRDTTPLGAGQVDDAPYGGGAGMVLRVDVVDAALQAAYQRGENPRGFNQLPYRMMLPSRVDNLQICKEYGMINYWLLGTENIRLISIWR